MRTLLCVCPPRVEFLFPPVLSESCNQIPLAFKVWFSRNSSSRCPSPRFRSLTWGSEPSLQWVDFCGIIVLQFVSHPASSYGIWFYCDCAPPTFSLWLLLCLWMWGIIFGEFQCLPVNDYSAVSCDSGVLARGSESTSFYSVISVQAPIHNLVLCVFYKMRIKRNTEIIWPQLVSSKRWDLKSVCLYPVWVPLPPADQGVNDPLSGFFFLDQFSQRFTSFIDLFKEPPSILLIFLCCYFSIILLLPFLISFLLLTWV